MTFSSDEADCCSRLVSLALAEDLGERGDVTSAATLPADLPGSAVVVGRAAGVVAGLPAVAQVAAAVDPGLQLELLAEDGQPVAPGHRLAVLRGPVRSTADDPSAFFEKIAFRWPLRP